MFRNAPFSPTQKFCHQSNHSTQLLLEIWSINCLEAIPRLNWVEALISFSVSSLYFLLCRFFSLDWNWECNIQAGFDVYPPSSHTSGCSGFTTITHSTHSAITTPLSVQVQVFSRVSCYGQLCDSYLKLRPSA